MYFKQDQKYQVPETAALISLKTPQQDGSAKARALFDLYMRALNEKLSSAGIPAVEIHEDEPTLENVFAGCAESEAPSAVTAPDLLRELAGSHGHGKVTLLATGPLSNIAQALHDSTNGSFRDQVDATFVMGGAVHVGGNLCCGVSATFDNSQEFNIWTDPAGASDTFNLLRSDTVTLIPLDATNFVPLLESFDALLEANPQTGAARFVAAMVADPGVADSVPAGFLFWWDPLAAVAATTHNVVRYESDRITVVQSGPQQGALVAGSTGASMRVGIFADQQKFQSVFFRRLNATPHHHDD
jgi:purine nucleosidase